MKILISDILKRKLLFISILVFSVLFNLILWNSANQNFDKNTKYFYDITFEINLIDYNDTKNKIYEKYKEIKKFLDQNYRDFYSNTPFYNNYINITDYYPTRIDFPNLIEITTSPFEKFKVDFVKNYKLNNKELNFSNMTFETKYLSNLNFQSKIFATSNLKYFIYSIISNDQDFENTLNSSVNNINDDLNNSLIYYSAFFNEFTKNEIEKQKQKISNIYKFDTLNLSFIKNINLATADIWRIKKIEKDYKTFFENYSSNLKKKYADFIKDSEKFFDIEVKKYTSNSSTNISYTYKKRSYPLNYKIHFLNFAILSILMSLIIFLCLNIYFENFKRK